MQTLETLNQRLMEAQQDRRRLHKLQADLAQTREMLHQEQVRLEALRQKLQKEGAEVERLEGLSLEGLFHALLGNKDERLEKERQELVMAQLEHDECREAVAALEREARELKREVDRLSPVESAYRALLTEKEQAIMAANDHHAAELLSLSEQLADALSDERELQEAISAGNEVLDGLDDVLAELRSAGNWGTWDMLGGGMLATAAKRSRMDDARVSAKRVQRLLRRFQRELADVDAGDEVDLVVPADSIEVFADYFFDGLIIDWVVQSKIRHSEDAALRMQSAMRRAVARLQRRLELAQERVQQISLARQRVIESA